MRKADYAALAEIIRAEIAWLQNPPSEYPKTGHGVALMSLATLAENFAARASVNRAEFLKACGLTP